MLVCRYETADLSEDGEDVALSHEDSQKILGLLRRPNW